MLALSPPRLAGQASPLAENILDVEPIHQNEDDGHERHNEGRASRLIISQDTERLVSQAQPFGR